MTTDDLSQGKKRPILFVVGLVVMLEARKYLSEHMHVILQSLIKEEGVPKLKKNTKKKLF